MICLPALVAALALGGQPQAVLYDFYADWCGPCRQMQPAIEQLAAQGLAVKRINVDHEPALAKQFRVEALPTLVLVADGREVDRRVGAVDAAEIQAMVQGRGLARGARRARQSLEKLNPMTWIKGQQPDESDGGDVAPAGPLVAVPLPGNASPSPLGSTPAAVAAQPAGAAPAAPQTSAPLPVENAAALEAHVLATTVRLKIDDATGHSWGTGTVIDARDGAALILTCGHIFRESQGKGAIHVDLFGPDAPKDLPGRMIVYDLEADLGLVAIEPPGPITVAPVAPRDYQPAVGQAVVSGGCDNGSDPSLRRSRISSLNKYLGSPNIQVAGQPVGGRSGGGLFCAEGYVIGVCYAADPADDEGLYSALAAVHKQLDAAQLDFVYLEPQATALAAAPPPEMPPRMPSVAGAGLPGPQRSGNPAQSPAPTTPDGAPQRGGMSPEEEASLAAIRQGSRGAEVVCVIRAADDPQARSEVIVLDNVSHEFLEQLLVERRIQEARQLTGARVQHAPQTALSAAGMPDRRAMKR